MKFTTKGFTLSLLALLTVSADAYSSPFDGWNINFLGGVNLFKPRLNQSASRATFIEDPTVNPPLLITEILRQQATSSSVNAVGEVGIGYGKVFPNCFYLGTNIFGAATKQDVQISTVYQLEPISEHHGTSAKEKIKLDTFEYGIDLKPGYLLTRSTLLVAHIGAVFNELDLTSSHTLFVPIVNNFSDTFAPTSHKDVIGLRLGAGIEQYLGCGFSLNVDYIYTDYGRISLYRSGTSTSILDFPPFDTAELPNGNLHQADAHLRSSRILMGLTYHFLPCPIPGDCCFNYCNQFFSGWYGALYAGDLTRRAKVDRLTSNVFIFSADATLTEFLNQKDYSSIGSILGEAAIGYGWQCNRLYLGAEAFVNFNNKGIESRKTYENGLSEGVISNLDNPETETPEHFFIDNKVKFNTAEYGIDLTPGFLLCPKTLIFLRVGGAFNRLEVESFNHNDNVLDVAVTNDLNVSKDKNVVGLRLGAGINQYICKGLALSLNYIYTDYHDLEVQGITNSIALNVETSATEPFPNGFISNNKIHVDSHTILLGLTYHFAGC